MNPMKYIMEICELSQGNLSNYLQDTVQISPGQRSNISRTPIKYLQDIDQISPGHPSNISRTPIRYLIETYEISHRNLWNLWNLSRKLM